MFVLSSLADASGKVHVVNHDEFVEEFTALAAMRDDIYAERTELNAEKRRYDAACEFIDEYNERMRSGGGVDPGDLAEAQQMYESQRLRADELRERWSMLDESIVEYNRRRDELREAQQVLTGGNQ